MNKREHVFIESLYNDIQESYSKNIRENYVLYSPVFCPNTGEYGAKKPYSRWFYEGISFYFLIYLFLGVAAVFFKKGFDSIHSACYFYF